VIQGRAIRLGDDVNTDNILTGAYLNVTDREELGRHLFETYPGDVGARIRPGDVLVAGENCGMGSSREHAQLAIPARGVHAIIAASFARIFLRNCINLGIPVVESREAAAAIPDGDTVRIDLARGSISWGEARCTIPSQPAFVTAIIDAGGLVEWARHRLRTGTVAR
jgi:3-isopropylmalate/(R)-2-methylmalate dehydratase small subunit